jgi:outer membrane protein assembly factor BamB
VWRLDGDGPAYGSPTLGTLGGTPQIVTFTQRRLVGIDPDHGKLLWEMPYQVNFDNTALTPLVYDGLVVVSAYKTPIRAYRPRLDGDAWIVEQAWENAEVSMDYSAPVLAGGRLVGFSVRNKGQFVLLEPASGELVWSGDGRQGENAFLVAVGDLVLALGEQGDLQILRVSPQGAEMLQRYSLSDTTVWAYPALLSHQVVIKDRGAIRVWEIPPG